MAGSRKFRDTASRWAKVILSERFWYTFPETKPAKNDPMATGIKEQPMYSAVLFGGAIRPMYSVILGELAISPNEKSIRKRSISIPFCVEKHKPMATEAMRIPVVITFRGL